MKDGFLIYYYCGFDSVTVSHKLVGTDNFILLSKIIVIVTANDHTHSLPVAGQCAADINIFFGCAIVVIIVRINSWIPRLSYRKREVNNNGLLFIFLEKINSLHEVYKMCNENSSRKTPRCCPNTCHTQDFLWNV